MTPDAPWSPSARRGILIPYLISYLVLIFVGFGLAADRAAATVTDVDGVDTTGESTNDYDIRIPRYEQTLPAWGIQLGIAPTAFNSPQPATSPLAGTSLRGASLQVEYQPAGLQKYGIFGIGPGLGLYRPTITSVTSSLFGIWSADAQIRYQARYWREQPVVPAFSYQLEYFSYTANGSNGKFLAHGPVVGLWILLNSIDRDSASTFYIEHGISRSYFVAEMRMISGGSSTVTIGGQSLFFGLRFEL